MFYCNPSDKRLLVPKRAGYGVTLNLGHAHCDGALSVIMGVLLLGWFVAGGMQHGVYLKGHPAIFLWLGASLTAALVAVLLQPAGVRVFDRFSLIGYGIVACVLGFFIQRLVNGGYVAMFGGHPLTWRDHLFLGPGAAFCQTSGKMALLALIFRLHRAGGAKTFLMGGLMVGLGFAAAEIVFIGLQQVVGEVAMDGVGLLGVGERGIAGLFHVYSSGLIALALIRRKYGWVAGVAGIHSFTDWLAGVYSTGAWTWSVGLLEGIFALASGVIWLVFVIQTRGVLKKGDSD
ncbi:MAG: DUF5808 domain-containing protein [Verrucomicrobiae bacterium]|nr:DUF5808 domain-containing protein [Verrucomicrobiae bacterium]